MCLSNGYFLSTALNSFLIFSAIYANINPLEWWITQNVWGRVLLVFLELGILTSIFSENESKL